MEELRPIKHTYIVESTDALTGFLTGQGVPMLMPRRFANRRKYFPGKLSLTLKNIEDVRISVKEVDNA